MAPEIFAGKPYSGFAVDLFACGIILFIMVTKSPPFFKALPSDPLYLLLVENNADKFWSAHSANKPAGFFSNEFKFLLEGLLQENPVIRFTMADVKASPWFNMNLPTAIEVKKEFAIRKEMIT